jgi:hypothetical protein
MQRSLDVKESGLKMNFRRHSAVVLPKVAALLRLEAKAASFSHHA